MPWTDLFQVDVVGGGFQVLRANVNTEDLKTASGVWDINVDLEVDAAELT